MNDEVPGEPADAFQIFDSTSRAIEEGRLHHAGYARALAQLNALGDRSEGADRDRVRRYVEWLVEMWIDATSGRQVREPGLPRLCGSGPDLPAG